MDYKTQTRFHISKRYNLITTIVKKQYYKKLENEHKIYKNFNHGSNKTIVLSSDHNKVYYFKKTR